ncbi:hypothetical protein NOS3756_53990 [Nostoc sp. NIES-3756]|uniref:hypothetical protein n=1 Tax=Nostoc sp. NIES-3756 TaxID=1751286 RepID=UPI0007214904|nr:hypothetical protein [Nostoc sp. NIES-3756]BAT56394.1 hypothetical protein NOS3756_53990 [Nostoc sp. NIES-3756]
MTQPTSEIETIEVHNVAAYYCLDDDGEPAETGMVMFARPQDWGNQQRWHYEFFRFEWTHKNKKYINNCHCWTDIKDPEGGYPLFFAQSIVSVFMPGTIPQHCGREFLRGDDFWSEEWGEMPPYYDPYEEQFDDDEVYE